MSAEREVQRTMDVNAQRTTDYVGALIQQERRLVLVPVDPQEPWAAFKTLRSWMRRSDTAAQVDLFATDEPIAPPMNVVSMEARRRKGA